MKSILRSSTVALAALLCCAFLGACETISSLSTKAPEESALVISSGQESFFVFDEQDVEVYAASSDDSGGITAVKIDGGVTHTSKPVGALGAPSACAIFGSRALVSYDRQVAILDELDSSVIWRAHLLDEAPTAIGVSSDRLAFVADNEISILGARNFGTLLRADMDDWLEEHEQKELHLALPLKAVEVDGELQERMLFISYTGKSLFVRRPRSTLVQIVQLGDDSMPVRAVSNDPLPDFQLQAVAHDNKFAYAAGMVSIEEGEDDVDYLIVNRWPTSNLLREEVLRVKWPTRTIEGKDKTRSIGDVQSLRVRGDRILLVHEDGSLLAFAGRNAVLPKDDSLQGVASADVLTRGNLVAVDSAGQASFPAVAAE